jgi:phage-related protein
MAKGDALEWANQVGIRLRGISKMTENEAAGWSQNLVQLAGDMASFFGGSVEEAATAINSALTGEFEPIKRYGVIINDAALKAKLFALTGEDVKGTLTAQQKQQATLALLMEQTSLVQGDYARNADGATNAQRTMTASLKDAATTLGSILLPYVTKGVQFVTKLVKSFQNMSPTLQKVVVIGALVAAALGPLIYILGMVATAIGFIATPVGLVVAAIAGLVAAFVYFYKTNESFRSWVQDVVAVVRKKLAAAFDFVRNTVIPALGNAFTWIKDEVIPKVVSAFETIVSKVQSVASTIRSVWDTVWNVVSSFIGWLSEHVGPVFSDLVGLISAAMSKLVPIVRVGWTIITTVIRAAIGFITSLIRSAVGVIAPIWSALWNIIRSVAAAVWGAIRGIIEGALRIISGVIRVVTGAIRGDWSKAWDGVKRIVSGAWDVIKSIVRGGVDTLASLFRGIPGLLSGALKGLARLVSAPFRAMGDAIRSAWNNTIGGKGFSIPDIPGIPGRGTRVEIPRLHSGGIFRPGMGAREGLALLERGETVLTAAQAAAVRNGLTSAGAPTEVHVHFHGPVARDSERWIVETIERAVANGHQVPRLKKVVSA